MGRGRGTVRCTAIAARSARGRFTQKIPRHPTRAASPAPYSGPRTLPSSCAAPTAPRATGRACSSHRSPTRAIVIGSSAPPAIPWSVRPAVSIGIDPASAVTAEPAANPARQAWISGRRPYRSESCPSRGIAAMYPSRNPVTTGVARSRWLSGTPTSLAMSIRTVTTT